MAWFAELAGKAEKVLNNLDEQTGAALRNHTSIQTSKAASVRNEGVGTYKDPVWKKPLKSPLKSQIQLPRKLPTVSKTNSEISKRLPMANHSSRFSSERNSPEKNRAPERRSPERKRSPERRSPERNISPGRMSPERNRSPERMSPERNRSPERRRKENATKKISIDNQKSQFNFEECPRTLVHEMKEKSTLNVKQESQRSNLKENENFTFNIENLDVENAMLINELNVANQEMSELQHRLCVTEEAYQSSQQEIDNLILFNKKIATLNDELATQVEQLNPQVEASQLNQSELKIQTEHSAQLEEDIQLLRETVKDLEAKLREQDIKRAQSTSHNASLENELRHAHAALQELQEALDKSTGECCRLEKDWDTYKVRVKKMLAAKDKEIKSLQAGMNLTEDTKILMEQIDSLKVEREDLTLSISQIWSEYEHMKECLVTLETRSSSSEQLVDALRDALKEERAAKSQLEKQYLVLSTDIRSIRADSSKTIALLKAAVTEKEAELSILRESASTTTSQVTSSLNVGDYDDSSDEAQEKIEFLTQKLVQRQENVDKLLADNNMLRIQLDSLVSKHKSEVASLKNHSVVNLDVDTRPRSKTGKQIEGNIMKRLSLRIGFFIRRYPIFRLLIIVYMIGLHAWVSTVLFTNAPDILP